MAYGLGIRALIEDGTAGQAARARSPRSPVRRWHKLSQASRIELIEQALRAANDPVDGFPLAL
jgi:hypothetical protein